HVLNHSDATLLVAGDGARAQVEPLRSRFEHIATLVTQGGDEGWGDVSFTELRAKDDRPPRPTVSPADNLEIIYTSGTTGLPKGVMTTHGAALRASKGMALLQGLGEGRTVYCVLPLYHSAA